MSRGFLIVLIVVVLFPTGCLYTPEVESVEIISTGLIVARVEPVEYEDACVEVDVPRDAEFLIHFTEPVSLTSLDGRMRLRDATERVIDLEYDARLETVRARPYGGPLEPGCNHVLEIDAGIEDLAGYTSVSPYYIAFYTSEEQDQQAE